MSAIDPTHPSIRVRALFLSDFHFGYKGVDAAALVDCLKTYSPQTIYLVGDIIDGWKLLKRWHWCEGYTHALDALTDHRRRGVKIIYLPGNHDDRVRKLSPIDRAKFAYQTGIRICNSCIHRTKDGRRIVILHGDQFDNFLIRGPISRISDRFFDLMTDLFDFIAPTPLVVIEGRKKRFSLAKALIKKSGKTAFRILGTLERAVVRLIRRKNAQGLICGHTHLPKIKMLRRKYFYGNCGMWMGYSNTGIIETMDGQLELIRWPDMRKKDVSIPASQAVRMARHYETALTIRRIRQMWPSRKDIKESEAESVDAQALQGHERIIHHQGGDGIEIVGVAPLRDKLGA